MKGPNPLRKMGPKEYRLYELSIQRVLAEFINDSQWLNEIAKEREAIVAAINVSEGPHHE